MLPAKSPQHSQRDVHDTATMHLLPNKHQLLDVGDSGSKITGASEPYENKIDAWGHFIQFS